MIFSLKIYKPAEQGFGLMLAEKKHLQNKEFQWMFAPNHLKSTNLYTDIHSQYFNKLTHSVT